MSKGEESMAAPKVSIGLAVYNGENYLAEAIESLLAQTFTDFELIISDNASTDRTAEICQSYVARDPRIRYSRNATNIGGANNENRTFRLARGQYFRWAAHDDICAPTLIEECVKVLDENPSAVLVCSTIIKIDEHGQEIGLLEHIKAYSNKPWERFRDLTGWDHNCEETYGLIRSDIMRKTDLQRNYTDSDRTLLAELSLYGKFYYIPTPLFYKRIHPTMSTNIYPEWRNRMAWFMPDFSLQESIVCPHWLQFFHYLRIIKRAPLNHDERYRCYRHLFLHWLFSDTRPRVMISDVVLALIKLPRVLMQRISAKKQLQRRTLSNA